jgi:arylsulfatase A-like enzyme
VVPAPFNALYDPAEGPRFRRALSAAVERTQHPLVAYWHDKTRIDSHFLTPTPGSDGASRIADWQDEDFRVVRGVYWGMVTEVDHQIGRVLDAIADKPGDTIVVLTSDHGEMLGDHWTLGKFGYFDQSFHVPLVVSDPRRPARGRVDAFTEAVDILPTILDLVGSRAPRHIDGRSLVPFLDGATPADWRDAVHWEYDFREVATGAAQAALGLDLDSCSLAVRRDARFKYVSFAGLPPLLFDLSDDPDELIDRSDDPACAAIRLACAEKLLAWRARHLDRTLTGIELTPKGLVDGRA